MREADNLTDATPEKTNKLSTAAGTPDAALGRHVWLLLRHFSALLSLPFLVAGLRASHIRVSARPDLRNRRVRMQSVSQLRAPSAQPHGTHCFSRSQ